MGAKATKQAQLIPASTIRQARASVSRQTLVGRLDNPLQAPAWQPDYSAASSNAAQHHNGAANFSFANIPVLSPHHAVQAKLSIGQANDKYEQEADRVADQVMGMPDHGRVYPGQAGNNLIQRTCATCANEYTAAAQQDRPVEDGNLCPACRSQAKPLADQITPLVQRQEQEEEEEEETPQAKPLLQRQKDEQLNLKASATPGPSPAASPGLATGINALRGGGQPLSPALRGFMEPRFGRDFSGVRVHYGGEAANVSRSINARAFTLGNNIVFGKGEYTPETSSGRSLLAHELTHVIQQGGARRTLQRSTNEVAVRERQPRPVIARQCEVGPGPFPGDGLAPPGDCSWAEYLPLLAAKESAAAVVNGLGACRAGDDCNVLALKIAAISAEIAARLAREAKCFRGGDRGHRIQICDKVNMMMRCYRFFQNSNCPQELVEAMEVVVTAMRAAIVVGAVALTIALVVALIAAIVALLDIIIAALAAAAAAVAEAVLVMLAALVACLA